MFRSEDCPAPVVCYRGDTTLKFERSAYDAFIANVPFPVYTRAEYFTSFDPKCAIDGLASVSMVFEVKMAHV